VYLYDVSAPNGEQFVNKFEHRAPVLDACFGDDNDAYTAGVDWDVKRYELPDD
jgi:cell cycle arrest protein BUB3